MKALYWLLDILGLSGHLGSPEQKGELGESHVYVRLQKERLTGARILMNRIFEDAKGTTEVDAILVSPKGVFVIEVKHWQGWIYGSPADHRWTQVSGQAKRKKTSAPNPLKQNERHLEAVRNLLDLDDHVFHSLVVFSHADCELKTDMPENVVKSADLMNYLDRRELGYLSSVDIERSARRILSETKTGKAALREHISKKRSS